MSYRPVGILGGMGPEATVLLQQRLLALVAARDDADHLPLLIDMNPQVPSRIAHLIEGTGDDPGPVLAQMSLRLAKAGATALAMPCNTAHHYASQITDASPVPLLNMVTLSVDKAQTLVPSGAKVGILASPAVHMARVFDAPLSDAGLTAIWPADQDQMLGAIKQIKAQGPCPAALATLQSAAHELTQQGAQLLLIACSEFSLFTQDLRAHVPKNVPLIDTVDVLAHAIRDHIQTMS